MQKSISLFFLLVISVPSYAVTIDFQSLEQINNIRNDQGFIYEEDGFRLENKNINQDPFGSFGTLESRYTGSTALFNNTIGGETVLTQIGGGAFDLTSIDLAELNGNSVVAVTFTTNNGDSQTFTLDGIAFGAETFFFNAMFLGVTSVSWLQESPFHQFDNIVINGSAVVPVPAAVWLFGSALLGFAGISKRKTC